MPGLPQEIIIDLTNLVKYPENIYKSFGIFCWHGYNSNPKVIELLINESNDIKNEYHSLGIFNLELKSGIQIFNIKYNKTIDNCKQIKFLKIIIKENFGEKWTYINQIMLYDEDETYINNILKASMISLKESEESFDNDIDIDFDNDDINNNNKKKLYHVERIEQILKKNILENKNDNDINKLSNISQPNNNSIFKNVYTNTPNRFIFNKTNSIINNKIINKENIIDKKRPYTPNIVHTKENENIIDINNNNKEPLDSKDYDNILKTQLKDMENQINLLNKINISNEKTMNKTSYNKFYSKLINQNINNKERNFNTISINNNNKKKNEFKFNTPQLDIKNHNLFQNSLYSNLNDLPNNNSLDINQRLSYLEKSVYEIKQELNSMSNIISNIISGKYIQNNLKQNIKLILDEYLNEKNSNKDINNNERSFYNEILNEENKQKNIENEINKKLEQKLHNITEQIKYDIYNKYIKPSLNQIEFNMKQSFDELKNKLDKTDKNKKLNNKKNYNTINNINNINNKNAYEQNNFSGIKSNNDILYNSSYKLTEDKYEEINKLGEKLYQKLKEKEKKLKLLKKETSKFLEDE